jgi:hypothetical protein
MVVLRGRLTMAPLFSYLLQLCVLLSPLGSNILLGELPCLALEHSYSLLVGHLHLIAHWYQATCNVIVVLPQQIDCKKHVVNVVEYQSMLVRILLLLREKSHRMLTPMSERVEVVRCVVAIVVAVTIALRDISMAVQSLELV